MEVIVVMGIFSLLALSVGALYNYSSKSNRIIWEQLKTQNQGRKAVQDFVNDLRGSNYSNTGAYPLDTVEDQEIVFYSDADKDNYRERIRFFLDGDILKKGVTVPTGTLLGYNTSTEQITPIVYDVHNTSSAIFHYYDQTYAGTATTSAMTQPVSVTDVKMVGIDLKLERDPTASPAPLYIGTKAMVRNLKNN